MLDQALRAIITLAKAALALNMPIDLTSSQEDRIQGPIASCLRPVISDAFKARIPLAGVVESRGDLAMPPSVRDVSGPVSYTHLDVYKRQGC